MQIQISCVVLSYNGGDSLIRTLESCKLQTYPYKDLVIADDASTDNGYTESLIEKWLAENSKFFTNVLFIKNEGNMGIVENLRNASRQAQGEILFGLGQGDLAFDANTLEQIANDVQKYKDASNGNMPLIWLSPFKAYSLQPSWHEVFTGTSLPYQLKLIKDYPNLALRILLSSGNFICGASFIYSAKFYDSNVYPLRNISNIEDYPALLYMLLTDKEIGFFDFATRWYEHGTGISTQKTVNNINKMHKSIHEIEHWLMTLTSQLPQQKQIIVNNLIRYRSLSIISKLIQSPGTFFLHVIFHLISKSISYSKKLKSEL